MLKLFAFAVFSAALPAYAQFEGVIDMKMEGGDPSGAHQMNATSQLTVGGAGVKMRMHMDMKEMGGGMDMVTLIKLKDPTMVYRLDETAKTYSVMDTKKAAAHTKARGANTYKVKKLGTDTVAGLKCVHVEVEDTGGGQTFELWTTKELINGEAWQKMMANQRGVGDADGMMEALKKEKADGFIARMKGKDKGGKGSMNMEIVKFEKKTIPASEFEIPADYTKSDSPGMGMMPPEAKKKMEEAMKNLTPEQREAMKKAMEQHQQQQQ